MELVRSNRKRNELLASYRMPEAESTLKLVARSILWTPYLIWKLRQMEHTKATRFWFPNRNNEAIEGVMYSLDDKEQKPIVVYDCGYKRGRSNFPMIGKAIACLGYRAVSIFSREELKAMEADDYTDALAYLRTYSQYKRLFGPKTAFVVISGGGNVLYRCCSSQEFVDKNQVVCGVSIATYSRLDKQFEYMKEKLKDPNIDKNARRVLLDYNDHATRIGLTPDANPEMFRLGSPVTYAPELKVRVLVLHGESDPIVEAHNAIEIKQAAGIMAKLRMVVGEGFHGNPEKWKLGPNFSLKEAVGVLATVGYAYHFLKKMFRQA